MELNDSDLTAWYGTSDAPAPPELASADSPVSLIVGVRPAHPVNGVDVSYRLDQGPELEMRTTLARTDYSKNQQFFRADFPPLSPGTRVEYAPIIRRAGRKIDFRQSGKYPSSFCVAKSGAKPGRRSVSSNSLHPHPYRLEHLTRGDLSLEKTSEVIGETPEGLRLNFLVSGGSYNGKINGRACRGSGDWLTVRPDGIGIMDVKETIITDDGAYLLVAGSGTVDFGQEGYSNLAQGRYPSKAPVAAVVRFLSSAPQYAWLDRLQCMGIGYATTERVCYDIYGVQSLCT
jgi:hypothetical protein